MPCSGRVGTSVQAQYGHNGTHLLATVQCDVRSDGSTGIEAQGTSDYCAFGLSTDDGAMIGSHAVVAAVKGDGTPIARLVYLGGKAAPKLSSCDAGTPAQPALRVCPVDDNGCSGESAVTVLSMTRTPGSLTFEWALSLSAACGLSDVATGNVTVIGAVGATTQPDLSVFDPAFPPSDPDLRVYGVFPWNIKQHFSRGVISAGTVSSCLMSSAGQGGEGPGGEEGDPQDTPATAADDEDGFPVLIVAAAAGGAVLLAVAVVVGVVMSKKAAVSKRNRAQISQDVVSNSAAVEMTANPATAY